MHSLRYRNGPITGINNGETVILRPCTYYVVCNGCQNCMSSTRDSPELLACDQWNIASSLPYASLLALLEILQLEASKLFKALL